MKSNHMLAASDDMGGCRIRAVADGKMPPLMPVAFTG